jgi:hypothetical protein
MEIAGTSKTRVSTYQTHCHTATRQVTTIPLMTNQSYDQNFLKKISIQSIIVMSLHFHFKLHFELCAQSFDYRNTCYWDNIFMGATYLNPPRPVGGCIFHLSSYFQLTTRCSERILFVSRGVPVNHNLSKDLPLSRAVWNTFLMKIYLFVEKIETSCFCELLKIYIFFYISLTVHFLHFTV